MSSINTSGQGMGSEEDINRILSGVNINPDSPYGRVIKQELQNRITNQGQVPMGPSVPITPPGIGDVQQTIHHLSSSLIQVEGQVERLKDRFADHRIVNRLGLLEDKVIVMEGELVGVHDDTQEIKEAVKLVVNKVEENGKDADEAKKNVKMITSVARWAIGAFTTLTLCIVGTIITVLIESRAGRNAQGPPPDPAISTIAPQPTQPSYP